MARATKAKVDMPYLVGLDIGFGQLKWMSNAISEPLVIPSGTEPGRVPNDKLFDYADVDLDNLVVSTEDGTFLVGKYAMDQTSGGAKRTQVRDRAVDPRSRVLFHTGIGLSLPHESGKYEVYVVTGLPNEDMDKTIYDNLDAFLQRPFTVTYHLSSERSVTKEITIVGHEIVPQPQGATTYTQFRFDKDRFLTITEDAVEIVGIIDIGHFTTDYGFFRKGSVHDQKMSGSCEATQEVYDILEKKLEKYFDELGYSYTPNEKKLDEIIRTGVAIYMRKQYDVSHLVEEAARDVAEIIAENVLRTWGDEANSLEHIILTGGGAYVIAPYLKEEFTNRKTQGFTVVESPEFSNVIGFYMYGAVTLVKEYGKDTVKEHYVNNIFLGDEE